MNWGHEMMKFGKVAAAVGLATMTDTSMTVPADARTRHHYSSRTRYYHKVCRYSSGSTGLVAGGVAGGLVGHSLIGHGLLGVGAGAVGGAIAGRAVDRSMTAHRRCYWVRNR